MKNQILEFVTESFNQKLSDKAYSAEVVQIFNDAKEEALHKWISYLKPGDQVFVFGSFVEVGTVSRVTKTEIIVKTANKALVHFNKSGKEIGTNCRSLV